LIFNTLANTSDEAMPPSIGKMGNDILQDCKLNLIIRFGIVLAFLIFRNVFAKATNFFSIWKMGDGNV
jgi:hypothetical protein